jgi:uncharacterized protein (DUF2141 family)
MTTRYRCFAVAVLGLLALGAGPASRPAAQLTVTVTDLRNHKGDLIFGVFDQPKGFPNEEKKSVNWQVKKADADRVTFTCQLPPGRYSASVLHDENGNGQMDTSLGIPQEGYGVTNNPKPKLRKATFKEALFDLPKEGAEKTISVQYFQ